MKFRMIFSWYIVGLLLLAPAAHGEDTTPQTVTEQLEAAPQEQLQVQEKDEPFDAGEPPATQSELQGVRNELQVLRDQWQRGLDRTVVQTKRLLAISGTGQFGYNQIFNSEPSNASTFQVNNFILNFKGNLRKDYEQGKDIDYALGINASNTLKNVSVTDAWLSYQILNSLDKEGPRLSITAGQQKKYFGLEATATEEFKPTISGAQFATALNLDERDIGVVLAGDLFPANDYGFNYRVPTVQYYLGVINGTGPNAVDINDEKDVFTRIVFNAPVDYSHPLRGLTLGGSWYYGRKSYSAAIKNTASVTNLGGTTTTIPLADTSATQKGDKTRWGVDLSYVNTPVGFTFEYVQGRDLLVTNGAVKNGVTLTKAAFRPVTEEGITFTLFYNFGDQFINSIKNQDRWDDWYPLTYQPFYRYDRYTPDLSHTNTHTDIHTFGFNWFFAPTTKLQVNYNLKKEYPVDKANNQILAQFQFGF